MTRISMTFAAATMTISLAHGTQPDPSQPVSKETAMLLDMLLKHAG